MIGWLALLVAVVALVRTVKRSEGWQAGKTLHEMATPEQFGYVELGGPLGGEVAIRRNGAQHDEILTAGAWLRDGQMVRIQGDTAYPTPDIGPIGWKP